MLGKLEPFRLERFFAKHEFNSPYLLCCSDSQPLTLQQALEVADDDSRKRWDHLSLAYTESQGLPALRVAIADLYKGGVITADNAVVCVPEEGILLAMSLLTQQGDHMVVTYPGYQSLYEVAQSRGCQVSHWEPRPRTGGALVFDVDDLKALLRPGQTKLVVANFPHNPTGAILDAEQLRELASACKAAGARLFSDEMYKFLPLDDTPEMPSAVEIDESAVALCGMSKCWGMPGVRLGWLVSQDTAFVQQASSLKDYTTICNPAPSEVLALMALRASATLLRRQRVMAERNLDALDAFFGKWSNVFEWTRPRAGTVAFPRITTGEDVEAFCERVVAGCGVLLLPGSLFDHPASVEQGRFRIGFGRADCQACLDVLDAFLEKDKAGST